jgi:tetratricopeptide (TPR) repeat protein
MGRKNKSKARGASSGPSNSSIINPAESTFSLNSGEISFATGLKTVTRDNPNPDSAEIMVSRLAEAERLLISSDVEAALNLLIPASKKEPNNLQLLDLLAEGFLQLGAAEDAYKVLSHSISLSPNQGHMKWLNMSQLVAGLDAVTAVKRGINCMINQRKLLQNEATQLNCSHSDYKTQAALLEAEISSINHEICSAQVSIAELFMTDCCDEENAEQECEKALQQAIEINQKHPETLYQLANLRFIQQRDKEAANLIRQCVAAIRESPSMSTASALRITGRTKNNGSNNNNIRLDEDEMEVKQFDDNNNDNIDENDDADELAEAEANATVTNGASYELRVNVAKLLLELGEYSEALTFLDELLEEDERVLEVLHLAAVARFHLKYYSSALENIETLEHLIAQEEKSSSSRKNEEGIDSIREAVTQLRAQCEKLAGTEEERQEAAQDYEGDAQFDEEDDEEEEREDFDME